MRHQTKETLDKLLTGEAGLYNAALPGYKSNFSRDSLIYGLIAGDTEALLAQIKYSAEHQGKEANAETGEEVGKIHHELPSAELRGRQTAYNGCDTTAFFLIAIAVLVRDGHVGLLGQYKDSIDTAVGYIKKHIRDDIFYEDPALCGAEDFALRVTYWKDSVLNNPSEKPGYPIAYSLVHFQNAAALMLLGEVHEEDSLTDLAETMYAKGMNKFWKDTHFIVGIDEKIGVVDSLSSDSMHSLLYIPPRFISNEYVGLIVDYSKKLETKCGYRSGITEPYLKDVYHTRYLWVFEQALLNAAAVLHNLPGVVNITERVSGCMGESFPELLDAEEDMRPAGNMEQLWSVGAAIYFEDPSRSFLPFWGGRRSL